MWERLKELTAELGEATTDPSEIQVDFEPAALSTIRSSLPAATIVGCRFHLGQCFIRHIQEGGLREEYADRQTE
ncbi:hypothetical protein FOCC_FOCC017613 [Frankliniella occidentalis]|nr:hypothetical protein FOCC_FOCC017613 [Frankliniella occidentalis]